MGDKTVGIVMQPLVLAKHQYTVQLARYRQRCCVPGGTSGDTATAKRVKHLVAVSRWQWNFSREYQVLTWLKCDTDEQDSGSSLVFGLHTLQCFHYARFWFSG